MLKSVPNILTLLRILLVPVFILLVVKDRLILAAAAFIIAGITDVIDGVIARAFNVRSPLGEMLDPFADKLLLSSSYVALAFKGLVPLWLCVPVVAKDVSMLAGLALLRHSGRKIDISPSVYGKLTTVMQTITVIYAMTAAARLGAQILTVMAAVTALLTVYTWLDYARRALR